MREQTLIKALEMHDSHINGLRKELHDMRKIVDKTYVQGLTHVMMYDALMELLDRKSIITKAQFDEALKDLSDKTQAAMEAEQKKRADAAALAQGKVTVLSDTPAIPVVK